MIDLLSQYSISEILIFIVILALAFKGVVSFFDWLSQRMEKHYFNKQEKKEGEDMQNEKINSVLASQQAMLEEINQIKSTLNLLVESDRDSIKSFITKEYKQYVGEQGWIDEYSLEILEKRFHTYELEGGNSFILQLMSEIRALPHKPDHN